MNVLISHIEYLLTQHDCVIIPGFGGFVLRYQAAAFSADSTITPPGKIASFNASLTHNDGLLANSLMREKNIPFSEAMILIEAEVHAMHSRLQQGLSENLNSLGTLQMGEEGELIFTPSEQNLFDLSIYGFSPLNITPIVNQSAAVEEEKAEEVAKPDVVMVPVNMRVLRRVCAVAILIVGFLCVSHPLEQGIITQHYASLISSSLLEKAIVPNLSYVETDEVVDSIDSLPSDVFVSETEEVVDIALPIAEVEQAQPVEVIQEVVQEKVAPMKRYYIVVGSFPTQKQAQQRISYLTKKGVEGVQYLVKDRKYRLYINTFTNKVEANAFLEKFKATHPDFADAWLLAHRS